MSPILRSNTLEIISKSTEQTRRVGMRLGALLQVGDLICLEGELGAGKTTFVKGVAAGWGSYDAVSSPTFVLVNVYRRHDGGKIYHLDAYRLKKDWEAVELDLEMMLSEGPLIVEWADHIRGALLEKRLWINMHWVAEQQRDLILSANGKRYLALLNATRTRVYGVR